MTTLPPEVSPSDLVEQLTPCLRTIRIEGRALSYLDIGTGPTVLLIHGLGASWHVWASNLQDLARDHRLIAVDLPGFGSSDRPPRSADLGPYAADVVELLDRLGCGPLVVVGHSLGGIVAQRVAAQLGSRCRGLILVSSAGAPTSRGRLEAVSAGLALLRIVVGTPMLLEAIWKRPRLRDAIIASLAGNSGAVSDDYAHLLGRDFHTDGFWRALGAVRGDVRGTTVRDRWSVLTMPTLVLWGDEDKLLPSVFGRALAEGIPGAAYEEWAGVGHGAMVERPAEFNALLRTFVAGLTPNAAR